MTGIALFLRGEPPAEKADGDRRQSDAQRGWREEKKLRQSESATLVWASLEELRTEKALPAAFRAYRKAFEEIVEKGPTEDEPEQLMLPV